VRLRWWGWIDRSKWSPSRPRQSRCGNGIEIGLEEGLAAEGGEANLHAVGHGVGGGSIDLSLNEEIGYAVDVGEDGGGIFGELEGDRI